MLLDKPVNLTIKHAFKGKRLDKYLVSRFEEDYSRTFIQGLINNGDVTVCGRPVKSSYEIRQNDVIDIKLPEIMPDCNIEPEDIPINVIYEDDHIMVINKSADMIVHPARGHARGTLVNAVKYHCDTLSELNGPIRPGIVHRLDRDTTGAIIIAKTDLSHSSLGKQFENREVQKEYLAVVEGKVQFDSDTIQAPIGRDKRHREKMAIRYDNGKPGFSRYQVAERFKRHTLVKVFPKTGRTHQIRVHMKYIGHPIIADAMYTNKSAFFISELTNENVEDEIPLIERQALHAHKISFTHPSSRKLVEFKAELPPDMNNLINGLKNLTNQP